MPKVVPGTSNSQERITELKAVAAALREDLPKDWYIQCVGGCTSKKDGKDCKVYEPGHRWIAVITPWAAFDVSVRRGIMSIEFDRFNRFEVGMEVPDSLEQLSRAIETGALAYRDGRHVGN